MTAEQLMEKLKSIPPGAEVSAGHDHDQNGYISAFIDGKWMNIADFHYH